MIKPSQSVITKWLKMVTDHGCIITGSSNIDRHHAVGRKYVKDKHVIGEIFVLPLSKELHWVGSNHPLNITHHRKAFVAEFGRECDLFLEMCRNIGELPFDDVYIDLILETNR